jgi:CoA-transferase family III
MPLFETITNALNVDGHTLPPLHSEGTGGLPSWFDVTGLAVASIGAAACSIAALTGHAGAVDVDRRLASMWFGFSIRPQGWTMPAAWDPIAGDYQTKDGWIKLHTNAPAHRAAVVRVLSGASDRNSVQSAVADWQADDLEHAVVDAGGCAAALRSSAQWLSQPQGIGVSQEPLIAWDVVGSCSCETGTVDPTRPLAGVRVLDLTRVLAGPVATRCLAAYGADVLRIDAPDWDEPGVVAEVTLGKRCSGLDLRTAEGRSCFLSLLGQADIFVHGLRNGALDGLGLGQAVRLLTNPQLIEVSLNAWGWTGPWANRRGFDSLVQMACGIAQSGMVLAKTNKPSPLPVQALDHATGWLMAAAAARALFEKQQLGVIRHARLSLARMAALLSTTLAQDLPAALAPESAADLSDTVENTAWGPSRRVRFPAHWEGCRPYWDHPAGLLRSSPAAW